MLITITRAEKKPFPGGWELGWFALWGVAGLAENIATQPSLAGAWAELGKKQYFVCGKLLNGFSLKVEV